MIKLSRVKIKKGEIGAAYQTFAGQRENASRRRSRSRSSSAERVRAANDEQSASSNTTRDYDSDDSSLDIGAAANAGKLNITRARGDGVTRSSIIEVSFQIVCAYFTVSFCFIAHAFPTSGPKISVICTKYMPFTWVLAISKNLDRLLGWLFFSSCPHFPFSPYKVLLGL